MIVLAGYFGSGMLVGAAGVCAAAAVHLEKCAANTEVARNNTLSKTDGESIYAAIICSGESIASSGLFPTASPVLLGRIRIKEVSSDFALGVGPVTGNRGMAVTSTIVSHANTIQLGFPERAYFKSDVGPVVANHLDLAEWDGTDIEKDKIFSPTEASPLLRSLGLRVNLSADNYFITKEWFVGAESTTVSIFADLTKRGSVYEIDRPKQLPFIVTTMSPHAFTERTRAAAINAKAYAKAFALGAAILGSGAYAIDRK
jgi:hypothetical protein